MISIGMQLGGIVFGDAHWVLEDESRVWMKMSRSTWVHGKTNESARLACFLARDYRTQGAGWRDPRHMIASFFQLQYFYYPVLYFLLTW